MNPELSFVIPCYCSEKTVPIVLDELIDSIPAGISYEIICVNDCSPDDTFHALADYAKLHNCVSVIDLAKNVGQHNALMAGYRQSRGKIVITLEDDGQSPPAEYQKLVDALKDDMDVVYARYGLKKQALFRNLGSRFAGVMGRAMMGSPKGVEGSSFFAAKRFVIDEITKYENPYTFVHGLILRATSKIGDVAMEHRPRTEGKSGYSFKKLVSLWLNGFTSFSVKPLRLASVVGVIVALIGFAYGIFTIIQKILFPDILEGYSSTIAVILFIGGINMMMLGMLGEYVGRIFISINNAPQYVIKKIINGEEEHDER